MADTEHNEADPSPKKPRSEKRQRPRKIEVRCSDDEHEMIMKNAESVGLSGPGFLRSMGMKFRPKSVVDQMVFTEMLEIHADLNRIGGLIKLWLSERETKLPPEAQVSVYDLQRLIGDLREASTVVKNKAGEIL